MEVIKYSDLMQDKAAFKQMVNSDFVCDESEVYKLKEIVDGSCEVDNIRKVKDDFYCCTDRDFVFYCNDKLINKYNIKERQYTPKQYIDAFFETQFEEIIGDKFLFNPKNTDYMLSIIEKTTKINPEFEIKLKEKYGRN